MLPLLIAIALVVATALGFWAGRSTAPMSLDLGAEIERRDRFIEELRETTWQHREIAPELATIVLDEISTFRKELP